MKNNLLLILAVTIIALGIITAVIVLSAAKVDDKETSSRSTTQTFVETEEPYIIITQTEEPPEPVHTRPATTQTSAEPEESDEPTNEITSPEAEGIIATARLLIGTPFAEDGDTPEGFDNSGFIYYVLRENGYITCPRGVAAQAAMGISLDYHELKAGDLVFFYNETASGAGFGGIYIGDGKMISCLMPGTSVKEVDISTGYYRDSFYKGVSLS